MVKNFEKWVYKGIEVFYFASNLKGCSKELQNTLLTTLRICEI